MSSNTLHFEKEGVFLGLLSYPYYCDGKNLYKKLELFFKKHKDNIWKYDPSNTKDDVLYKPAGYRMFGSQGLAIISLVDDYTFYNRHFNKNHIQTVIKDEDLIFNTTVISGITETDNEKGSSLIEKAKNTFLKKSERFHFIGIIRLKINHELLLKEKGNEGGIQVLRKIKSYVKDVLKKECSIDEYISIDCFDNDEMTIIAFSNNLLDLYNFLGEIRSITNKQIGIKCTEIDKVTKVETEVEKHIFGTALLCFGYDVGYDLSKDNTIVGFKMNCLIETKAGHRDDLYSYLDTNKKDFFITDVFKTITGGCSIIATFPLNQIIEVEKMCKSNTVFLKNVRRMKVVLLDVDKDRLLSEVRAEHASSKDYTKHKIKIPQDIINKTKDLMKEVGLSKLVRERLMALFELYNNSCQNLLQLFYLEELRSTMLRFYSMIEEMRDRKEQITKIEDTLNVEISNMENAIYDRLHRQKHNQPPLEYSGGIQQYLTSFDYAYKYISRVFSPKEQTGYVTITGADRASSARSLFNLNINDIIFPELFITTAWKEVANFAIKLFENYNKKEIDDNYVKKYFQGLEIWNQFSQNEESFNILKNRIIHSDVVLSNDKTSEILVRLMDRELLMYFIKDYIVFHFAFQENYQMMWYYYFKTMLQTTICYCQLNVIDRKHFVHMLMRLFMVGLLSDNKSDRVFIEEQIYTPFDHLISDLWMKDYNKTWEIAKDVFDNLEQYGFKQMNKGFILVNEQNIEEFRSIDKDDIEMEDIEIEMKGRMEERKTCITTMIEAFKEGHLVIDVEKGSRDYIICLFYAYLETLYEMDNNDKSIKSIPRNSKGDVIEFTDSKKEDFFSNSISVLVDPTGGFFVPSSEIRKKYFQIRTVLYRSLWNYRFTNKTDKA